MAIFKQKGHKGKKQIGCAWPKFSLSFVNSISCFKTLKMAIFNKKKRPKMAFNGKNYHTFYMDLLVP